MGSRRSVLRLGTRAERVAQRLRAAGMEVLIVPVRTVGDAYSGPTADIGVGVFVSALREALVAAEVDAAVHSYKDLPTAVDPRLVLAAGLSHRAEQLPGAHPEMDPRTTVSARPASTRAECETTKCR